MKDSGLVHLLKELLEQSQTREAASLERIKEQESQLGELLELNKSMQDTTQAGIIIVYLVRWIDNKFSNRKR